MMGMGIGLGFLGWFWMLLFWVGLIVLAIWLVGLLFPPASKSGQGAKDQSASEILKRRLARGELSPEQYQEMMKVLRES